ncbi:hypothetical protein AVEN_243657-1 [Araneus ventricosus]|uniref:Uncharacterized protein n=1 Tax=Araneus ventricosus TaxID=182803 RepID=A0A4Y2A7A6_ARAVE|nr:hypothetical protein AVEN_243657-1 [Araneus ventricosus]
MVFIISALSYKNVKKMHHSECRVTLDIGVQRVKAGAIDLLDIITFQSWEKHLPPAFLLDIKIVSQYSMQKEICSLHKTDKCTATSLLGSTSQAESY